MVIVLDVPDLAKLCCIRRHLDCPVSTSEIVVMFDAFTRITVFGMSGHNGDM